ncbi:MAG: GDP-mannose 4,6-dehydratase [Candidatus Rokubacteria bacterium]|nr:GDP-mannose 4,6-dehydratase [Candidatus Rokubacteria bacterium]
MSTPRFEWRDRPVLVTGATGLLGRWLVHDLVARGADVIALVRDELARSPLDEEPLRGRVTRVRGAVEDLELMTRAVNEYEVQAVFHLAAQTIVGTALRDPVSTFTSNVQGTWCVLEACRRAGTVERIVVASSDKAYGVQAELPYREEAPLLGRHPYDVSKACADLLTQSYAAVYGLPATVTRCGNLFGGGDLNWNRIVPGTIRGALRGTPPVIRSDGTLVRDYFYVKDAVDAYVRLAEQAHRPDVRGRAFNFSENRRFTVLEICHKILEAAGRPDLTPVVQATARHEIPEQYLDSARARAELGWTPLYGLEAGLAETVKWYAGYLGEPGS